MHRFAFIFILIVLPFSGGAQPGSFSFRNISINQGLSQSSVVDIAIDPTGFVWMATQDGLNRFDGRDFITFPLNFDDITTPTGNHLGKITPGLEHKLWLISRGGKLHQMELLTQSINPWLNINNEPIPPVSCVFQDSAYLFIGTRSNGLWIYQQSNDLLIKFNTETLPTGTNEIKDVFKDIDGYYWILTGNGLIKLSPAVQIVKTYLHNEENPIRTSSITQDVKGTIWVGTFGQGIFFKHKNADTFKQFVGIKGNTIPSSLVIETLLADTQGQLWIGSFGEGLFILQPEQNYARHFLPDKKDPFSLAYTDVLKIIQDKRGGIWIGTDGGGVSYYDKRLDNFRTYSGNNLPDHISIAQVRAITTDHNGDIWCGTSTNGVTVLKKEPERVGNYKKIGSLLTDKDGDIWIGTQENGLDVINPSSKKVIRKFLPGTTIWALLEDESGNVWAATRQQGLFLLNKQKGEILHLDNSSSLQLPENNVRTLTFSKDSTLFIGFETEGICELDIKRLQLRKLPSSVHETFDGKNILIRSMYYTPEVLWIGSFGNGLFAFEFNSGKVTRITDRQGLWNNTIYGILPGEHGCLWLSTNKGLCRLHIPSNPERISRSDMFFFTVEDGLQSNEFNTGAYYRSPDGLLYFGGIDGLTTFNPATISVIEQPGKVLITEVQADDTPLITDTLITYKKILRLPYRQNSLSFSFAAFDVLSAGRLNFSYQLSGFDKGWLDAGTRNYAAYTHLPSGKYVFMVTATRSYPMDDAPVATLTIIIEPPFWRTPWFIILCVVALAASLYGIYRYRISQLIRLQKVRNRIASDLHDDIGSALTHISILSELSKGSIDPKEEANNFLGRISEEVASSGQALDDIVWSINSRNDTMEQTVARMRRYVAEVLETKVEKYSVDFDDRFANRKLNMEQRRDFFLLFKELINNIYKHSKATQVDIRIWIEKNTLYVRVADNGIGFDKARATERNGVKNMQFRTEKWKGRFHIDSTPGVGTIITASMPLT